MKRRLLVAALVLLAGCGAGPSGETSPETPTPTATPAAPTTPAASSPTPTPTSTEGMNLSLPTDDGSGVEVRGGELAANATLVFRAVERMLGVDVSPPDVVVREPGNVGPPTALGPPSTFERTLGLVRPETDRARVVGFARGDVVRISRNYTSPAAKIAPLLVHEFVHVVQFETDWEATLLAEIPPGNRSEIRTRDGWLTYTAVVEGTAVYVTDRYARERFPNATPPMRETARDYETATGADRLAFAPYYFGGRYVASALESPANVEKLSRDPPETTEQLLHGADDPLASLSVRTEPSGEWSTVGRPNRMGELFVRVALRTELNRSRAAAGADGWGNDRRVTYQRNGSRGYAWVLTWDDRANATEFTRAVRAYLDARATRSDGVWTTDRGSAFRLERPAPRTVIVFLGDEGYVRDATVSVRDGTVVLR